MILSQFVSNDQPMDLGAYQSGACYMVPEGFLTV
jgi:hypothetical protein